MPAERSWQASTRNTDKQLSIPKSRPMYGKVYIPKTGVGYIAGHLQNQYHKATSISAKH